MYAVKNIGRSPRGIRTTKGSVVVVEPGQTKEINISNADARFLLKLGTIEITSTTDAPLDFSDEVEDVGSELVKQLNKIIYGQAEKITELQAEVEQLQKKLEINPDAEIESLRKQASELGVEVDGRWSKTRLQAEIDKALES